MSVYKYTGVDRRTNKTVHGTMQADDTFELKKILKEKRILLSDYQQLKEKKKSNFLAVSSKAKKGEFVTFCKQFSIMLKAGVSIAECLNTLRKQKFSTVFQNDIASSYEDVLKGCLLSEAFRKHPKNFPEYFVSMVYVGELSGSLATVLVRAAEYYDRDLKTKAKVKSAMIYPIFLIVIVTAIFFLLMLFVLPSMEETLAGQGQELPGLTIAMMNISKFVQNNILYLLVGGGVGIFLLIMFFRKTSIGKYIWSLTLFHLPVFRGIKINNLTTRFGMTFGILLESGMQVYEAMKIMPNVINDKVFEKKFAYAIEEVNNGKRLSRALENTQLFPPMLIQMVTVGENTSSLEEVLTIVGDYYNNVLVNSIQKATSLLEPIAIVLLGAVVMVVIMSVMLPMFNMVSAV